MSCNYSSLRYTWLIDPSAEDTRFRPEATPRRQQYPIPPEIGEGWLDLLTPGLGMTLSRGVHRFRPAATGHLIPLMQADVDYHGPNFMVQAAFGSDYTPGSLRRTRAKPAG